jgi:hypothetical protein
MRKHLDALINEVGQSHLGLELDNQSKVSDSK